MTNVAVIIALGLGVALMTGGVVAAFASSNALKKVIGVITALIGSALALAMLGAPNIALISVAGIAFAYAVLGAAVAVRQQEAYGTIEAAELDAADQQDEPREPAT